MKFNRLIKKALVLTLTLLLLMSLSACNGNGKAKLNVGCFPNITHSQALYGMVEGSFDDALNDDTEIKWYTFNAGPTEMESIRAGNIDIGYIGPIPAITGYASSGGGITVIAGVSGAGSVLVTAKDKKISDVSELSGLTVAVPQFGNTQDIILRMLLDEAGLASTDNGGTVEIVQQSNVNIKSLLVSGQIDAALVPEPWGSRLVAEAGANVLLDYDEILGGDYPVAVIVVRNDYLKNNRDTVKAFLREHIRLTRIMNDNQSNASKTVNDCINSITGVLLSEDILDDAYGRINFDYNINEDVMNDFLSFCIDYGIVSANVDYDGFVDTSLLREVLEESRQENTAR